MKKIALATLLFLALPACTSGSDDPSGDETSASQDGTVDGDKAVPPEQQGDKACAPIPPCKDGELPVDTGNDGCFDTCTTVHPPTGCDVVPVCASNEVPVDTNGDTCLDACSGTKACAPTPPCKEGEIPFDTGTDGCYDTCVPKK